MKKHTTIKKALAALGISADQKTDPALVRDVLREMHLDDFQTHLVPMQKFLRKVATEPQDLTPMLCCVQHALEKKHPAIVEFTEVALQKGWLKPGPRVQRALHTGYVLETLTVAMSNNHKFLVEISNHLIGKGTHYGIDCHYFLKTLYNVLKKTHGMFEAAKGLSVDPLMTYYRLEKGLDNCKCSREEIRRMYANHTINFLERELLMPAKNGVSHHFSDWVRVNIYEAGITDHVHGFDANAECAEALNEDMKEKQYSETMSQKKILPDDCDSAFYASVSRSEKKFPSIEFTPEWVSLYISWNAAFVTGNIDEIDIVLPKLFIPSVIDCKASNFIGVRIISLWLTIAHACFHIFEVGGISSVEKDKIKLMGKTWGAINKKYAQELLKKDLHIPSAELKRNSRRFYAHPFWNLWRTALSIRR